MVEGHNRRARPGNTRARDNRARAGEPQEISARQSVLFHYNVLIDNAGQ